MKTIAVLCCAALLCAVLEGLHIVSAAYSQEANKDLQNNQVNPIIGTQVSKLPQWNNIQLAMHLHCCSKFQSIDQHEAHLLHALGVCSHVDMDIRQGRGDAARREPVGVCMLVRSSRCMDFHM